MIQPTASRRTDRLDRVLESSLNEIYIFDADSLRFISVNRGARKNLGYSMEELEHLTPLDLKPEVTEGFFTELVAPLRSGLQETIRFTAVHRRKDGTLYPVEVHLQFMADDKPVFVAIILDITERKEAEEERRLLETQLVQAQKLEAIGQLAAGIAHEINTPTQYVGDNTRFIEDSFAEVLPVLSKARELVQALKQGEGVTELVNDLQAVLQVADIEYLEEEVPRAIRESLDGIDRVRKIVSSMKEFSHPGAEEMTEVDLARAIESTITVATNEWKYVAEMETDFDADLPPVPCLPGELNQVILNMIINAAHAIADVVGDGIGGKGTITITTRREGDVAEILISDTGAGIPLDVRYKVFEPFFTTKEVGRGTGQGLAIAHNVVVKKHGGTLGFETEEGRGTTFKICLPLERASEVDNA